MPIVIEDPRLEATLVRRASAEGRTVEEVLRAAFPEVADPGAEAARQAVERIRARHAEVQKALGPDVFRPLSREEREEMTG